MKVTTSLTSRVWLSVGLASFVHANNVDLFNYGYEDESIVGGGTSYGQRNWDQVTCDNLSTCVSKVTSRNVSNRMIMLASFFE